MSIKREELLDLINTQLKELNGQSLNLPLNNYQHQKLLDMFEVEENKIKSLAQTFIEKVQSHQISELDTKFDQDPLILSYMDQLKFFADHDLVEDASERYIQFNIYVKNTME